MSGMDILKEGNCQMCGRRLTFINEMIYFIDYLGQLTLENMRTIITKGKEAIVNLRVGGRAWKSPGERKSEGLDKGRKWRG